MTLAQIKFGLALADDLRRIKNANALPVALPVRLNTSVEVVIRAQNRAGVAGLYQNRKGGPKTEAEDLEAA